LSVVIVSVFYMSEHFVSFLLKMHVKVTFSFEKKFHKNTVKTSLYYL